MDIAVKQVGPASLVSVVGSVDALTAAEVADCLESQLDRGQTRLVLDLGQTDFLSSAGFRVLLAILKKSRQKGGDLRLAAVQPGVEHVLRLAGVTGVLEVFSTGDEAAASYGQGRLDVGG
jgi:anti-anti-sigma factor